MIRSRIKNAKALSLVLLAALTGCTSGQMNVPAANPPAQSPPSSFAPAPAPQTSSAAHSDGSPDQKATLGPTTAIGRVQARLADFQWVNGKTLFAWGAAGDYLRLYRTDDVGNSWTNVTPGDSDLTVGSMQKGRSITFLDADHVWVAAAMNDKPVTIYRSANGGRDWKSAYLDKSTYPTAIAFSSPQNGWLLTSSDAVMGSTEKSLYATQDGGASWKLLTRTEFADEPNNAPGTLPLAGTVQGLTFIDSHNGWLSLVSHAELPLLYRSKDGGKTWSKADLAVPKERDGVPMNLNDSPIFFPQERGSGWLQVRTSTDSNLTIDAFVTSDGGEHWTFTALGLQDSAFFLDSKQIWGWRSGALVHSSDSGATWKTLPNKEVLVDKLKAYPHPLDMQFVTSQTGFLLMGSKDGKKSLLLSTTDGGVSWTVK